MITIWKTPIVATVEQVLKDLKLQLYGAGLLKEIKNTGSDLMCTCPFHANGKEHNPSCGVLLQQKVTKDKTYEAGTVHCYTCGYTADLPQFVADLLGLSSPVEGFKWLVNQYNYQTEERELPDLDMYRGSTAKSSVLEESLVKQYTQNLLQSEEACRYLHKRRIANWVLEAYELGFDPEDKTVLFPVRGMDGKVIFYKGRSIAGKHFYNAKEIDKTSVVFGLWEILNGSFSWGTSDQIEEVWITHYAEVYSPTKIVTFKCVDDGSCGATGKGKARQFASYEFVEEKSHIFGRIPIITVYNNEEQMSDLEKIETLVNDYDKVLSDVSNEFEAFRNAYLMLKNMVAGNDSIQKLKDEGIVEVMENGDMKFITKEIQTEALENHLNRLEKNIHKFSAVPDLSDENFAGNLSGVAIRFKLFGLETKCIIKERKMEKAIKELVRVLSVPIHVNTGREVDVLNLKVEFSRNVPNNLTEIVDTVSKLDGKVDKETLLSLLPFIDNPKEVLEKLEADKERDRQNIDPYSTQNITEDSNYLFPNLNAQNSRQEALNAQGATIPQPEQ